MVIGGQCLGDSVVVHDDEGNAIGQRPFFVWPIRVKVNAAIEKFSVHFDEDDVRIGIGAIILKGVTIGRGARIGAGSVVARDVAPGVEVFGNPARPGAPRQESV